MTALNLFQAFIKTLEPMYGPGESEAISRIVFEDLAGINRSMMIINRDIPLDIETERKLRQALQELQQSKPVQQVTGKAWFYGQPFKVSGDVLIPRPETEELVDKAIHFLTGKEQPSIIDIGTGSGCIAISLKKNLPYATVTAIDTSEEALAVARGNALELGTEIKLMEIDFLVENGWSCFDKFDCIISNPPYIPFSEKETMAPHVLLYEPAMALFVSDERPLIFYEKLALFGKTHMKADGMLLVETHENLAKNVCALFSRHGYTSGIEKDLFGKERMVWATQTP